MPLCLALPAQGWTVWAMHWGLLPCRLGRPGAPRLPCPSRSIHCAATFGATQKMKGLTVMKTVRPSSLIQPICRPIRHVAWQSPGPWRV